MSRTNWTFWSLGALLSAAIAIISSRYLAGVGPVPVNIAHNLFVRPWLLIHVGGAVLGLLSGPFQFIPVIRRRAPQAHRWLGRLYMAACLVGGAAGLVLATGSSAGPIATAGFGALALSWIVANVQGWHRARQRRFAEHRAWMIRSFALTFAAVTLRLYLPAALFLGLPALQSYRAVSFLCWIPNLIVAELYLHFGANRSSPAREAPQPALP